jgi:hypothetical protein
MQPLHKVYVFIILWVLQFIFTFAQGLWKGNMCKTLNFVMYFTWIQMMIWNHVKCNDYSICIHMKKIQRRRRRRRSILEVFIWLIQYLMSGYKCSSFSLTFKCWQKWFIFLCHSWVYITSQYIGYRLYTKYWILSWVENLQVYYIY